MDTYRAETEHREALTAAYAGHIRSTLVQTPGVHSGLSGLSGASVVESGEKSEARVEGWVAGVGSEAEALTAQSDVWTSLIAQALQQPAQHRSRYDTCRLFFESCLKSFSSPY